MFVVSIQGRLLLRFEEVIVPPVELNNCVQFPLVRSIVQDLLVWALWRP